MKETQAACLLVGSVNPAIIRPGWLVGGGIVPHGKVQVKLAVGLGGERSAPPSFELGGFTWVATPSNLEIVTRESDADPGDAMAKVLGKLKHTPVRAVGNNFTFSWAIDSESAARLLQSSFAGAVAERGFEQVGASTTLRLAHPTSQLNLTLNTFDSSSVEIKFNFHREAPSINDACSAALKWKDDRASAAEILAILKRSSE